MSLTWHIVKKDLRALKWPLLVWVLLIVAKLGVGVILLNANGDEGIEWLMKMDVLARVLGGFEFVSFVFTAALIQEDRMVGTNAFWMTRPISGPRLLRAKLLGLGLMFGLLPVLVTLPWWLWCGYDASQIAWAAAETVALQAIAVLLALMWSTITDSYARFLMWTLATVFAVPTLAVSIVYWINRVQHTGGPSEGVMITRVILGYALAATGVLVVVTHQYLTRNTRRSVAVLGSIAGLIVFVGIAWPWNLDLDGRARAWLQRRMVGEWPAAAAPTDLKYSITSANASGPGQHNGSVGKLRLNWQVEGLDNRRLMRGVAGGQMLIPYGGECRLSWPDGTVEPLHAWARTSKAFGLSSVVWPVGAGPAPDIYAGSFGTEVGLNPWVAEKFKTQEPACTLTAWLRLMQFESATPVSLAPGAGRSAGNTNEWIVNAEKSGDELLVVFIRVIPSLGVDMAGGGPLVMKGPMIEYLLANKARDVVDHGKQVDFRLTRIATVGISWQTMVYYASSKPRGRRPTLEAINALDEAELIKVTYRETARFSQAIKADALQARWIDRDR